MTRPPTATGHAPCDITPEEPKPYEAICTHDLLGNFPRALTHLAVITAGLELSEALEKARR